MLANSLRELPEEQQHMLLDAVMNPALINLITLEKTHLEYQMLNLSTTTEGEDEKQFKLKYAIAKDRKDFCKEFLDLCEQLTKQFMEQRS